MATVAGTHEAALIAQHIDANPHGRGPADARLREYGTSVWALIAALQACAWNKVATADDFEIPVEAVDAAIAYYHAHKAAIDAKLLLNTAA